MTISNTTDRTSVVGSATAGQVIPFTFPITNTTDIVVKTRVITTGVETTLTLTTDYSVTITGITGGSVTLVAACPATNQVHVLRDTPKTQTLNMTLGGAFNPELQEEAYDKATKQAIEASVKIGRAIRQPDTDVAGVMTLPSSIDRASKYLAFDSSGGVITSAGPTGDSAIPVSAFAETLLDDVSATTALATLGLTVSTFGKTLIDDTTAQLARTTLGAERSFQINAKDYGAVGNGVADDTTAFLAAFASGGTVSLEKGKTYKLTASIPIVSNTTINGDFSTISSTAANVFTFATTVYNVEFNNLWVTGTGADDGQTAFDINGAGTTFNDSVHNLKFNNITVSLIETAVNAMNMRKVHFDNCHFSTNKGIYYTGKSAEVTITACYFIQSGTLVGSYGIKTEAESANYPEGISVTDTVLYQFERNLHLVDLYVAKFNGCYFDNKAGTPCLVDYGVKCEELTFNGCWFSGYGIQFGGISAYIAPKKFRTMISSCSFNSLEPQNVIALYNYVADISISNCSFTATATAGTLVGIWCQQHNERIIIDMLRFDSAGAGFDRYIQMLSSGANNSISNIPNSNTITPPIYLEYAVNVSNVEGNFTSATWDAGSIADGDEEVKEVTVLGAALGDFAIASMSIDVADLTLTAQVTAADTVTCQLSNNTGGAIDLASGTIYVRVGKK